MVLIMKECRLRHGKWLTAMKQTNLRTGARFDPQISLDCKSFKHFRLVAII